MSSPFCHVFKHDDAPYLYDVNSGDVFAIDPATVAALGRAGPMVTDEQLHDARRRIDEARESQGLFLSHRPTTLSRCSACHDPRAYDGRIQQLTLSITEQCNLRCGYCLHGNGLDWVRPHREGAMSTEMAQAAVREFLRRSRDVETPSISFYGGEPLLEFDLIREVVELVRREGASADYRFVIDTNGTRLPGDVVDFVVRERIQLQISLDGPADLHDRHRCLRGGGPTHAMIVDGIRRLLEASPDAHELIRFQVTLAPPGGLERVGAYFADFPPYREAGCDAAPMVGANVADLTGADLDGMGLTTGDMAFFREDLEAARRRYVEMRLDRDSHGPDPILSALFDDGLISFYHRSHAPLGDAVSPGGCCSPGQRRLHVRADGAYQPCERVGDGLNIGHVDGGLDLVAVDRLWERFTNTFGEQCMECWACRLCSLCFTTLAETWDQGEMSPSLAAACCDAARDRLENTLRTYVELVAGDPRSLDFLKTASGS